MVRSRLARFARVFGTIFVTLMVVVGGTLATTFWLNKPRVLRMVVSPEGGVQHRFAQKLAEALAANSRTLRLSISVVDAPAAALSRLARLESDVAIGRTDLKFPANARTVAVLERDVLLLMTSRNARLAALASLRGRKVAVVGTDNQNEVLVRRLMDAMQVPSGSFTLQTVAPAQVNERLIGPQNFQASVHLVPMSLVSALGQLERLDRRPGLLEVHGVDDGKLLERRVPGVHSETIEAGTVSSQPKWPPTDFETIALYHLLVVTSRTPNAVATELARVVFENKEDLDLPREFATRIEAPELGKDQVVIAHPGVADYVNGEVKTFFDRYSDMIYVGSSLLGIAASILYALYRWAWAAHPVHLSEPVRRLFELTERVATMADLDGLDAAERDLDAMMKEILVGLQDGQFSNEGVDILRLSYDHAHRAIQQRRRVLIGAPPTPIGQPPAASAPGMA
ncbi:MAG: TAXI family TRAP transporter solute-binding subunit [Alphaproteobacteria bacterium]